MRQQCALEAKKVDQVLGCVRQSIASRLREVVLPFFLALVKCLGLILSFQFKRDVCVLGQDQWSATKMIKGLEYVLY